MDCLAESVDEIAASTGFSGVVRVDRDDDSSFARAYGLAHRGHRIANTIDTRFGIASGTKGVTAVTRGRPNPVLVSVVVIGGEEPTEADAAAAAAAPGAVAAPAGDAKAADAKADAKAPAKDAKADAKAPAKDAKAKK